MTTIRAVAVVLTLAWCTGCPSPANDLAIEALGGECSDVVESEFHRPGQPCVLCHGDYADDSPALAIGGTVFATKSLPTPVEGVEVLLTDAAGTSPALPVLTNCIGNFQVLQDDWQPAFPIHAEIICPNPDNPNEPRRLVMGTRIGRDGSCATCHYNSPTNDSPGWVYCAVAGLETPYPGVKETCAGRSQDPACPTSSF